ncbi:DUF5597 domain-containing protein [Paenibacillus sp. 1P07SE]|uniref:GH35 family beta-galactosidase n=1 Tax=Paenibacillus sp. 1P07SE TaxID=3132209 RepID=UPI0039A745DC
MIDNQPIPSLDRTGPAVRLLVDGKPFIALAGEVHNSSSSSLAYMEPIWGKLSDLHCNTAIMPVCWELVEPVEGAFDFSLVDGLLDGARRHGLRLVLLWFGTWKNGSSTYVPAWVKTDPVRFPRMQLQNGTITRTVSCFSEAARQADAKAFAALMAHVRQADSRHRTVILVQVENEVGLLGSPRDYSEAAEQAFRSEVPTELVKALEKGRPALSPELSEAWARAGDKTEGDWKTVFGERAEEVFMCWHMAGYIEQVAAAGIAAYPLPMFVNAWGVQSEGEAPGNYPSGGPASHMFEVWRAAAPSIAFFAPDIYLSDFPAECASYTRCGNPLFIPEARRDRWAAANVFYAIGKHDALGFAPFGIESIGSREQPPVGEIVQDVLKQHAEAVLGEDVGDMLAPSYRMLERMTPLIARYAGTGQMTGIVQQHGKDGQTVALGGYLLNVSFLNDLAKPEAYPGAGILIAESPYEYIIAGHGFRVTFQSRPGDPPHVDYLAIDEGRYEADGSWTKGRRMNGDEGIVHLGTTPTVLKVSVYSFGGS